MPYFFVLVRFRVIGFSEFVSLFGRFISLFEVFISFLVSFISFWARFISFFKVFISFGCFISFFEVFISFQERFISCCGFMSFKGFFNLSYPHNSICADDIHRIGIFILKIFRIYQQFHIFIHRLV